MSGELFAWVPAGYLFGSVPFGLVLTRLAGFGDIRQIGSGNIGATNVLRTGSKPLAAATVLLDGGKGAIAALLAALLSSRDASIAAGVAAVFGHMFPLWLRFKGGKAVATSLGTFLALSWPVGVSCCLIWLVTAAVFRISSLSGLAAIAMAPAAALCFSDSLTSSASAAIGLAVFWRHQENISRLFAGTEPRIGSGR